MSLLELWTFWVVFCPYLVDELHVAGASIIIAAICILLITTYTWATIWILRNPVDPMFYKGRSDREGQEYEWYTCDWYVSESTKHWKACEKWVKGFDHHWIWLNNCIGYNNYRAFIVLITVYLILSVIFVALSISVIIKVYRIEYVKGDTVLRVYLSIFLLCKAVITTLICVLWLFHMYLIHKNITTFQFITNRRNK